MEKRPKIKIELTLTDKLVEKSGWILLILSWCLAIYSYITLPEIIPIHFDISGTVNGYGNKVAVLLVPVIGTGVFIGLSILNNYPEIFNYPRKITEENALGNYTNATRMLRYLKLAIALVFTIAVIMMNRSAQGHTEGFVMILPVVLGLIFIPLIFFTIKFFKIK
jgi:uncharacterized membrane protein